MTSPTISTQLDLWQAERETMPWGGLSPRALTRAYNRFIFKPEAQKDDRFFVDPNQYDLFPAVMKKSPPTWGGSPSLLPLPRRTQ